MSSLQKNIAGKKSTQPQFGAELSAVETCLRDLAQYESAAQKESKQHYIGTRLVMCGLTVPALRNLLKVHFRFQNCTADERFSIWNHIWKESGLFEAKSLAALYLEGQSLAPDRMDRFAQATAWTLELDNWSHSDSLSKFYSSCLEMDPQRVLPVLQEWNGSQNPWQRRQSLVSLLYYATGRKKYLPFENMIALVSKRLDDPHFYVQRGLGWTLREMSTVYPAATLAFLQSNAPRFSALAFSAAVEKISSSDKAHLKEQRARWRKGMG